jgi:hypothetical protein
MNDQNLLRNAHEAHQRGEYLDALKLFLRLREQKFDLIHNWNMGRSLDRIRLRDINRDGTKEIGALSAAGRFAIFGLQQNAREVFALKDVHCQNFRFFEHLQRDAVIISREEAGSTALSAYDISQAQGAGPALNLDKIRELSRINGEILDIAYKPKKIYVTDSQKNIHQYNAITLLKDLTHKVTGGVVQRLNTGGPPAADRSSIMYNHLLGILQSGGLTIFEIRAGGLDEVVTVGKDTVYTDAFIGDPDNDGIDNIIAFTQDGRLDIYDWDSLNIRCTITCPDELYAMYCHDIDGDGILEILVGGRSNRIYVFAIDAHDRELHIKWEYQTEHSVRDLWVGELGSNEWGNDKRLVAGLANGKLQVFKIHPPREINRGAAQAFRELSKGVPKERLEQLLSESDRPEVVRFGLDELTTNMTCAETIGFLSMIEQRDSYQANLHVLSKLKTYLAKFSNHPDLIKFTTGFLNRLFERNPDLPTCERICSALGEIQQSGMGGSEELLQLSKYFDEALLHRKVFKTQRAKHIQELVAKGEIGEANRELEILKLLGLDLLRSYRTDDEVTSIHSADDGQWIVFTTRGGGISVLDTELKHELFSARFSEAELHCGLIPDPRYAFIVSHGPTVDIYDKDFRVQTHSTYQRVVKCLDTCSLRGNLYWAVGLGNGDVVVEGPNGERATVYVPGLPVEISLQKQDDLLDAYVITSEGKVWRVRDVVKLMHGGVQGRHYFADTPPELTLGGCFNVLGWAAVESHTEGTYFLVISPSGICIVRRDGKRLAGSLKDLGRPLSSITLCSNRDGAKSEVILGTHLRSLLFLSPEGEVHKEVYLPDIPTALHVVRRSARGCEVIVGFAQGNINHYQRINQNYLQELEDKCDKQREEKHLRVWEAHDLTERVALIALAEGKQLDLPGIHGRIDGRIRPLIPKEDLARAVKALEQKNIIQGQVETDEVYYCLRDDEYAAWVLSRQDQYQTIRDSREELIRSIRLIDVYRINSALASNDKEWLLDFLLVDRRKWDNLVLLSEPIHSLSTATPEQRKPLRQTSVELLCAGIEAVFKKVVPTEPKLYPQLSAFEIQMPAVKFQGFDHILVVMLDDQDGMELSSSIAWIKGSSDRSIVLVITESCKELLVSALKRESFGIAVMDHEDLKDILLAAPPRGRFLDLLVKQINLVALSPFRFGGPVREMFYGREGQRQTIMNALQRDSTKCHAVIGPRRIGKTSLLQRVQREIEGRKGFKTVYLDCTPYHEDIEDNTAQSRPHGHKYIKDWYNTLLSKLDIDRECSGEREFITSITGYCRANKCRLVLFFDEVDNLLKTDQKNNNVFSGTLRALITEKNIKLMIAGYSVLYFQMQDKNSPLFNLFEPIELSALDEEAALALIEEPLNNIFHIDRKNARSIAQKTACYPNFIQFCCSKLVELPEVLKTRVIRSSHIEKVVTSDALYDHMVGVHLQNLDKESLLILYLMVAYYDEGLRKIIIDRRAHAAASKSKYVQAREQFELRSTFAPSDLHRLLEIYGAPTDRLETLMRKLVLASILKKEPDGQEYSFVLSDLPHIMRKNVEVELRAVDLLERIEQVFKTT